MVEVAVMHFSLHTHIDNDIHTHSHIGFVKCVCDGQREQKTKRPSLSAYVCS